MLRITKDTKYYGIDNIEKIITEIKSPMGFTNCDAWGFYTRNFDEKMVADIVDNFENGCEEITECTDTNLINDVVVHHTITNPLNPSKYRPTHGYLIGKYMIPERTGEEGNGTVSGLRSVVRRSEQVPGLRRVHHQMQVRCNSPEKTQLYREHRLF